MARRRRRSRVYYRKDRGFYGDFRDFCDVGGKQEALIPAAAKFATHDSTEAATLCAARLEQLKRARRGGAFDADPPLRQYAKRHLRLKQQIWKGSTVRRHEDALRNVLGYFGEGVQLSQITVRRLSDYVDHRSRQPGRPAGTKLSEQTILHELNALSSLYKRAVAEGSADSNPCRSLPERPKVDHTERVYLEIGEAARLLGACRRLDRDPEGRRAPFLEAIVGLMLLTGCRQGEAFGMLVGDVDFRHGRVWLRPNDYRGLKLSRHTRWVPMWPQLKLLMRAHVGGLQPARDRDPLFRSHRTGRPITSVRRSLERALELADIDKHVTNHTFRHTYTAARIQTTDAGKPVSLYTVARELGHSGPAQIESTYGHLLDVRVRQPFVEYREATITCIAERAS